MPFGFGRGKGGYGWGRGRGRGFRGGRGLRRGFGPRGSPPISCICPNCGFVTPHHPAVPCFQTKCPRCNSPMTRQFFYGE